MPQVAVRPPTKVKPSRMWFWVLGPWPVTAGVVMYGPALFQGDLETARLFLSTLLTSLVTILSLSVSVVWIGVQLSASQFGGRGLDYYLRFPYHVPMLTFFLVTLLRGGHHLAGLRGHGELSPSMARLIGGDAVLALISVAFLLFYMVRVVRLLHPEAVADVIATEYERALSAGRMLQAEIRADQFLSAATRAAREGDRPTLERCLCWFGHLLEKDGSSPGGRRTSLHLLWLRRWPGFARTVLRTGDPELARQVMGLLRRWGNAAVEGGRWGRCGEVVRMYRALMPVLIHARWDGTIPAAAAEDLRRFFLAAWGHPSPRTFARIRFLFRLFLVLVELVERLCALGLSGVRLAGDRMVIGTAWPAFDLWVHGADPGHGTASAVGAALPPSTRAVDRPVNAFLLLADPWLREAPAEDIRRLIGRLHRCGTPLPESGGGALPPVSSSWPGASTACQGCRALSYHLHTRRPDAIPGNGG
ncbi:MAG: DUF2254 family protein [Kyrpidia sp.]|nr:DUF2254 family protein [Kyrpidia sp.]